MSRLDKRHYQDNIIGSEDDRLRAHLYAFSNTRPTYKVVFSPASPIIIFKTKLNNEEQSALTSGTAYNPCKAWNSLAELLFTHHPNRIHAMYLLDLASWMHQTTEPLEEAEAQLRASSLGEVLRQTSNVVAKLNPANAHLLAAAASCLLALKFVLVGEKIHGHGDHRYVQQLLLVSPSSVALLRELTESAKGLRRSPEELAYPKPRVCVLVSEGSDPSELQEWLQSCEGSLFESTEVCFYNNTNPDTSLFHRLAVLTGHPIPSPEGSELDSHTRYATKRVYQIDFVLSKQTKTVEQIATRYPLDDEDDSNDENEEEEEEGEAHEDNCGCGDHHHHENHNEEEDDDINEEEEDAVPPTIITGISSLLHVKDTVQVLIEGRVLDPANHLVATTEGCVHAAGLGDLLDGGKYTRDATVTFSATVARDATGKTFLEVSEARFMTKKEVKQSYTVGESLQELPLSYLFSLMSYRIGAVLVRGRKCALIRDLDNNKASKLELHIPHIPHDEGGETATDCAMRALCECLEVSSDNFYLPHYLTPVEWYTPGAVVLVYVALAVAPPPQGAASDGIEDAPEPEEPYDWVSYERGMAVCPDEEEREVLTEVRRKLAKAHRAGLYKPVEGCGLFGEAVKKAK